MTILRQSVAILGGGITGLTAAYRLAALGHRVRIFEAGCRLGGAIRTEMSGGWLVESGPNTLREDTPEVENLLHELALGPETVEANATAAKRYLVHGGRLVAAPSSVSGFATSPLFSAGTKLGVIRELCARPRARPADFSVADLVRSHFGSEVLERAVQPLVSGTWAGDAEALSAPSAFPNLCEIERTQGSLLRGLPGAAGKAKTTSFKRGLQTLPWALTARLPEGAVVLNAPVERLIPEGGRWQVLWIKAGEPYRETFDAIVAPLPAPALAQLRIGDSPEPPLAGLSAIPHPPVSSVFLGYKRDQVAHPLDGYGFLVPREEGRSILGSLFSSTLFPSRAPAGCVALTVLAGGALQPNVARLPQDALLETVRRDLAELLGVKGEPVFLRHAFWPAAIPQYNVGHHRWQQAVAACEKQHPGLFLGGQAVDGISLSDCMTAGCKLADRAGIRP